MDMLNLLINPKSMNRVCFLCYKQSENTTNLHEDIEIHDEYFSFNLTLWNIMKKLFPSHDLFLPQACDDCASLIIKLFSLMQRNYLKNEMLNLLVNNINEEVDNKMVCERQPKKYKLRVQLPTDESIINNTKEQLNSLIAVKCSKCDMKFKSKVLLEKHYKITHKNTSSARICDICGKELKNNSTLKVHLGGHKGKQCPHCFKVLKSHSHFNLHLKNHVALSRRKRKSKLHDCGSCDYRSINKNSLEAHINKVHLNIRPYKCNECGKGFYKKSNLTQHFVTHEKVKDKTCEICGDTFVNEKTLFEHLMLHSGQKPFKCEICGADFITSGRRLEHMKRKHMEKAECCVICDKKFSLKKNLNSHFKKVHGTLCFET
nr:zinc finger protein 90-like [Helicoverpa armigera]